MSKYVSLFGLLVLWRRSLRPHWMVEKEGYIFVFGLDKEGSDTELEAYYELYEQLKDDYEDPKVGHWRLSNTLMRLIIESIVFFGSLVGNYACGQQER